MFVRHSMLPIFLILVVGTTVEAQSLPYDIASGLQPYQSYHGGDIDRVNLSNGNLYVHIPLVSYPQRGGKLNLDYGLEYNGKPFSVVKDCSGGPPCAYFWETPNELNTTPFPLSDWHLADEGDVLYDQYYDPIPTSGWASPGEPYYIAQWQTADSAVHPGALVSLSGQSGQISLDGTGFFYGRDYSGNCLSNCHTMDSSGTVYHPSSSIVREDSNGNTITLNGSGAYVDTFGRTIPAIPAVPTSSNSGSTTGCTGSLPIYATTQWQVPGANGSTMTFKFCYVQLAVNLPAYQSASSYSLTVVKVQSIVLPNQQTWTFEYNSRMSGDPQSLNYGDLTKITLPTGGTISYQYTLTPGAAASTASMWMQSRTVNANDGTGAHAWAYSLSPFTSTTGSTVANTVTDPNGNLTVHTFQNLGTNLNPNPIETKTQYYSGPSTLLKTVQTSYREATGYVTTYFYPAQVLNILPTSITTTLDNGLSTTTNLQYCCDITSTSVNKIPAVTFSYGRVSDKKVYDYAATGQGPLLRETATAYQFQNNSSYLTANMMDLVASTTVYDGSGGQAANAVNTYDEPSYLTNSGISTQHTSPMTAVRGNLTSVSRWLNGGTNPVSHTNWYDTGVPYQTIDPLSHPTTFGYSSTYAGALPTTVTDALNHATTFTYDFNTGQKTSMMDANLQTTTYSYNDSMNRLTSISYPDQGLTTIQYNDTGNIGVTVTQKVSSSLSKQTQAIVDGLGREHETILLSDPSGPTYTSTTYDALGREYQVWNPTRCNPPTSNCGEGTWGITTYQYDALSRQTLMIPPDGSSSSDNVRTSYSGNTTTVTDEAGNYRTSTEDALGRLTQVSEGTAGYITTYTYDALSNLTCVEQHGGVTGTGCSSGASSDATSPWRVRRFTYDSLSHLLAAKNPEAGTSTSSCNGSTNPWSICYTYDNNGNVLTKTDANSVTTTNTYDGLNRLLTAQGPAINHHYGYDSISGSLNQNSIGRVVYASNSVNADEVFSYDPMGRLNWQSSWTPSSPNHTGIITQATYDLAGNIASLTYPDGRVVQQTRGTAANLTAVNYANWNGQPVNYNYLSSATYWPDGAPMSATYGNGLTATWSRNNRLQPTETFLKNGSTSLLDRQYCYGPVAPVSGPHCTLQNVANNGSIYQILDILNNNNSQAFTYDNLNRISAFSNGGGNMQQTYSIDPWGNLSQTGTMSSVVSFGTNNRITTGGYGYDSSGNLTSFYNGVSTTTYAYDAEGQMTNINNGAASYTYDAVDQRVRKDSGGSWTEYVYFNGQPLTEKNSDGSWTDYIFANGTRLAKAGSVNATNPGATTSYYHVDQLGSTRLMTDGNGNQLSSYEFYPFGQGSQPDQNHYLFTGKDRDNESGNDYFGARYYSSNVGRFMSPDWSEAPDTIPYGNLQNPQSLNLYAYVNNNPLTNTDDDGHVPCGGSASITIVVRGDGSSSMSQSADDCPDGLSLWQQYSNWRQKMADDWNKRIEAHRPPQQPTNDLKAIQDTTDIMMGVGPVLAYGRFGWRNGPKWRQAVKELMKPGTHEKIAGEVPTRDQATMMIEENGGTIQRGAAGKPMDRGEEFGHDPGGVSEHTYPHINYTTPSGMKATVQVAP